MAGGFFTTNTTWEASNDRFMTSLFVFSCDLFFQLHVLIHIWHSIFKQYQKYKESFSEKQIYLQVHQKIYVKWNSHFPDFGILGK